MPSIGRSVGTLSDAPASAAKVVYQSWADSISSVTTPAGTVPGQRTIAETRIEPSHGGVMIATVPQADRCVARAGLRQEVLEEDVTRMSRPAWRLRPRGRCGHRGRATARRPSMTKYLLLKHYRGAPEAVNAVPMDQWTPAEVEDHLQYMADFATRLESTGEYVDGQALCRGHVRPVRRGGPTAGHRRALRGDQGPDRRLDGDR